MKDPSLEVTTLGGTEIALPVKLIVAPVIPVPFAEESFPVTETFCPHFTAAIGFIVRLVPMVVGFPFRILSKVVLTIPFADTASIKSDMRAI